MGLDQYFARNFYESDNRISLLLNMLMPSLMVFLFLSIILLSFFPQTLSSLLFSMHSGIVSFILLMIFFNEVIYRYLVLYVRLDEKLGLYFLLLISPRLVLFASLILATLFAKELSSLDIFILALIPILISNTFGIFLLGRSYVGWNQVTFNIKLIRKGLKFGIPLVFLGVSIWLLNSVDKMFLKSFEMYAALSLLSITTSIAVAVTFIGSIFNTIWMPSVYKRFSQSNELDYIGKVLKTAFQLFYLIMLITISVSWTFPYFVPATYYEVQYIISPIIMGTLLYLASEISGVGINLYHKTYFSYPISITAIICCIISSSFLIPTYQASGAVVSYLFGYFIYFSLRTFVSLKLILGISYLKYIIHACVLCIASIVFLFFGKFLPYSVIILVDAIILYYIWPLRHNFKRTLINVLARKEL